MKPEITWTNENKYRSYSHWSEAYVAELSSAAQTSRWRQCYHVQPETGLLNDPNGFAFYNGKWQLFYQAFPYGTVHGLKSWYRVESEDLIHWNNQGVAILPDTNYDSHGAYSGSSVVIEDTLYIFYTGNVRDENWQRQSYQLGATFKNEELVKLAEPLIPKQPDGYTTHFRDPQVIKGQDNYYLIIGAQTIAEEGQILVYKSLDARNWQLIGPIHVTDQKLGYMVECPHLVFVGGQPVLIFCPQGLDHSTLDYANLNPNTYVIGTGIDLDQGEFEADSEIQNLDDGFDAYATQGITTTDGRALIVSWLGISESGYPVCEDGWTNCLSLVKELTIREGQLYQYPVKEMSGYQKLIAEKITTDQEMIHLYQPERNVYELEVTINPDQSGSLYLLADEGRTRYLEIRFDATQGQVVVDRSQVGINKITETQSFRQSRLPAGKEIKMNIFVDTSSVEIFLNDGQKVISALVFPEQTDTAIFLSIPDGSVQSRLRSIE